MLPRRTWLDFGLVSHVHLHARAQTRHARNDDDGRSARQVRLSRARLEGLIQNLRSTVARLDWQPRGTEWADYAENTSYGEPATADKDRGSWTRVAREPGGAACGTSARTPVATAGSRPTQASASSPSTSTPAPPSATTGRSVSRGRTDILPLVVDIANPSPGIGWGGRERRSLLDRAEPDAILALALVHHLAISRNVPLPMVFDLFADLAEWAIVEFVPKEDPMVRLAPATRRDVFPRYTLNGFRDAAATRFEIVREAPLADSTRVLSLLRRRGGR